MASHIHGAKSDPNEVVRGTLAALEAGKEEFIADEITRQVKQGLSAEPVATPSSEPATLLYPSRSSTQIDMRHSSKGFRNSTGTATR
jgi:hypothetical protein